MSRGRTERVEYANRFPRVSGDEPFTGRNNETLARFSPRERG